MGLSVIKLNSNDDPLFEKVWDIYQYSFPSHEKRSISNFITSIDNGAQVLGYLQNNKLVGFLIFWEFNTFRYIEHVAISLEARNRGFGSKIFKQFISDSIEKSIILEIDPINDEISEKRYTFYQRLGFLKNEFKHLFPPYNSPNSDPYEMIIMSHGRELLMEEYEEFRQRLYSEIVTY